MLSLDLAFRVLLMFESNDAYSKEKFVLSSFEFFPLITFKLR